MTRSFDDQSLHDPAEATDGTEFDEQPLDDSLPGTVDYPPTRPVGVGPADSLQSADHHDSLRERTRRLARSDSPVPHEVVRLVDPEPNGELDTEAELLGDEVPAVGDVSPEEAAMHIEGEYGDALDD